MADISFNTVAGQTIARELQICYLNVGTANSPEWAPIGKRTDDSSMELDWSDESAQDILGNTFVTMKKPIITQTFDPWPLDSGDEAAVKIWNLAFKDQDAQALTSQDLLLVHFYAGTSGTPFAERYPSSMVKPTGLGGEGGGNLGMPVEVTFGGTRQTGTASKDSTTGKIAFTAA